MRILIGNDDGLFADGINALRRELETIEGAQIFAAAPDRERSASGHAITMHKPLFAEEVQFSGSSATCWSINGTPADCIKLGLQALLDEPPDLVISGINRGPNLGTDVFYSGTVSAAIEAVILGVPAIAVSLCEFRKPDYSFAARFTKRLALEVLKRGLAPGTLLNVNVPAVEEEHVAGTAVTKLGVRLYENSFDKRVDPHGRTYYWMGGDVMQLPNDPDTDVEAVRMNLVSVTPIHLDLTLHDQVPILREEWGLEGWFRRNEP